MAVEFVHYETPRQASDALYNELRRAIADAPGYHDEHGADGDVGPPRIDSSLASGEQQAAAPYVTMLAGGQSPYAVYHRIAVEPPRHIHPATTLMVSDDRLVPEDDERSNAGRLRTLVEALGLPRDRVITVPGDARSPSEAAQGFGRSIAEVGERGALFALAVLGIGADGHTASLFDGSATDGMDYRSEPPDWAASGRLPEEGPWAAATGSHGGIERVSVSARVLLAFRRLIFFAPGGGKSDVLYQLSRRPEETVAGRIMLMHPNAEIWSEADPRVE